jgi:hypothetical protein
MIRCAAFPYFSSTITQCTTLIARLPHPMALFDQQPQACKIDKNNHWSEPKPPCAQDEKCDWSEEIFRLISVLEKGC